jgi:uncharacterized protein (DUF1778 family)
MPTKNARVDIKTTSDAKALLEQAAHSMGTTLSALMLDSSIVRAREILAQSQLIQLNEREWARFINALENPPRPNEKLKSLFQEFNSKNNKD